MVVSAPDPFGDVCRSRFWNESIMFIPGICIEMIVVAVINDLLWLRLLRLHAPKNEES